MFNSFVEGRDFIITTEVNTNFLRATFHDFKKEITSNIFLAVYSLRKKKQPTLPHQNCAAPLNPAKFGGSHEILRS